MSKELFNLKIVCFNTRFATRSAFYVPTSEQTVVNSIYDSMDLCILWPNETDERFMILTLHSFKGDVPLHFNSFIQVKLIIVSFGISVFDCLLFSFFFCIYVFQNKFSVCSVIFYLNYVFKCERFS